MCPLLRLNHITFACEEPRRVAAFWTQLLDGYSAEPSGDTYFVRGDGPELFFKRMPKSPTIELPIHLDFRTDDREAEIERLTAAGATVVRTKTDAERTWTIMRDPEGNPFTVE
jgi:predicted enzyme related to lactoylglutathione lyase